MLTDDVEVTHGFAVADVTAGDASVITRPAVGDIGVSVYALHSVNARFGEYPLRCRHVSYRVHLGDVTEVAQADG